MSCGVGHRCCSENPTLLWLWCRPAAVNSNSTPSLRNSICHKWGPEKQSQKKKKKKKSLLINPYRISVNIPKSTQQANTGSVVLLSLTLSENEYCWLKPSTGVTFQRKSEKEREADTNAASLRLSPLEMVTVSSGHLNIPQVSPVSQLADSVGFFVLFCFVFFFLGPYLWHKEVPRPWVESEL